MNIELIVFYVFSVLLLGSALMVITSPNPVRGVLFLILAFFASSVLWMLLQAEFLALALIFVYVGAVMTLFLFVVMMLNIKQASEKRFIFYNGIALLLVAILVGVTLYILHTQHFNIGHYAQLTQKPLDYSNVKELGRSLYTTYAYAFEIGGVVLLVAILSAIGLAFRGRKEGTKVQVLEQQLMVNKKDRLKLVRGGKLHA